MVSTGLKLIKRVPPLPLSPPNLTYCVYDCDDAGVNVKPLILALAHCVDLRQKIKICFVEALEENSNMQKNKLHISNTHAS